MIRRPLDTVKVIAVGVAALLFVVGLGVAGWHFEWWLKEKNTDRQVQIDNRNLGTQTAWRDEAVDLINQAELLPAGASQALNLERQACDLIDRLTDSYLTDQLADFEAANC